MGKKGKVIRLEAKIEDFQRLENLLSKDFMNSIDDGEKEALALLSSPKYHDYRFVTADKAPIKALGILNWRCKGISLEELLEDAGLKRLIKGLPKHFKKQWFQDCLNEGYMEQALWKKDS